MALNTLKCDHLTLMHFKGLRLRLPVIVMCHITYLDITLSLLCIGWTVCLCCCLPFRENGLDGKITLLKGKVEEVDLPVEKVKAWLL